MSNPRGLPPIDSSVAQRNTSALDRSRMCPDCGQEVRLVSNNDGLRAFCGPCRKNWPISSTPMAVMIMPTMPRGLSKQTLIEPEWDRAMDDPQGDPLNEQIGPKRR